MASGPDSGVLRALRTGTAALAATGLAVAAHALTDGCVEVGGALLGLACSVPAAAALTSRRRGTGTVLAWLATVQVALHLILTAGCGGPLRPPSVALLAGHLLAVVVTAVLLNGADAALWAADALRNLAARVLIRLVVPHVPAPLHSRAILRRTRAARSCWRSSSPARRGPPVRAVAR